MRFENLKCIKMSRTPLGGGAYNVPPDLLAASTQTFVVLFADAVQVNAFVRKIPSSTSSNKSIHTAFARSLHLSVHVDS